MKKKIEIMILTLIIIAIIFPTEEAMKINYLENNYKIKYNNNILYVGGSGQDNYTKIQDTIDNASDGDTIFVFDESSPYYELLYITYKSINLMGENKNTTVLDGMNKSNVIYINGDNIKISGFTIRNSSKTGSNHCAGIFSYMKSDYIKIIGNNLCNNYFGIYFYYPDPHNELNPSATFPQSNNSILKNNISKNCIGIKLIYSSNNKIYNNNIINNGWGIKLLGGSTENMVYLNNFINNTINAYNENSNLWFNPQLIKGNYWDNYNGSDLLPPKGIGDKPYIFSKNGIDLFPLIKPYEKYQNIDNSPMIKFNIFKSKRCQNRDLIVSLKNIFPNYLKIKSYKSIFREV